MEIRLDSTQETEKLAQKVAKKLNPNTVIALYGDLGAGKTTFVGYLTKYLDSQARVQSPTFVLLRKYKSGHKGIKIINHLDLYRLRNDEEIADLGISELISEPNSITLIEWPEKIENILPKDAIKMYFSYIGENERDVKIENVQDLY